MANNLVIVTVNKNYRASVYDVADLKRYIESSPKEIDYSVLAIEDRLRRNIEEDPEYTAHKKQVQDYVNSILLKNRITAVSEKKVENPIPSKNQEATLAISKKST